MEHAMAGSGAGTPERCADRNVKAALSGPLVGKPGVSRGRRRNVPGLRISGAVVDARPGAGDQSGATGQLVLADAAPNPFKAGQEPSPLGPSPPSSVVHQPG